MRIFRESDASLDRHAKVRAAILSLSEASSEATGIFLSALQARASSADHCIWSVEDSSGQIQGWLSAGVRLTVNSDLAVICLQLNYVVVSASSRGNGRVANAVIDAAAGDLALWTAQAMPDIGDGGVPAMPCDIEYSAECISPSGRRCADRFARIFAVTLGNETESKAFIVRSLCDYTFDSF